MGAVTVWLALNTLSLFPSSNTERATKTDSKNELKEHAEANNISSLFSTLCAILTLSHALPEASAWLPGNQQSQTQTTKTRPECKRFVVLVLFIYVDNLHF